MFFTDVPREDGPREDEEESEETQNEWEEFSDDENRADDTAYEYDDEVADDTTEQDKHADVVKADKKSEPWPKSSPQSMATMLWCSCMNQFDPQWDHDPELEDLWTDMLMKVDVDAEGSLHPRADPATHARVPAEAAASSEEEEETDDIELRREPDEVASPRPNNWEEFEESPPPKKKGFARLLPCLACSPKSSPRRASPPRVPVEPVSPPSPSPLPPSPRQRKSTSGVTLQDFEMSYTIGRGSFSKVVLVRKKEHPHGGRLFAMKIIAKQKPRLDARARQERSVLNLARHSNFLIHCRYYLETTQDRILVTDYYPGGSLECQLQMKKSGCFPEARAQFHAAEVFLALRHMHELRICHRDLKLDNLLMDALGHVVISDLGFAHKNVEPASEVLRTFCGTIECIAPEVLRGDKYGLVVDWWAFGICVYQMVTGMTPFYDKNARKMFTHILRASPPTDDPRLSERVSQTVDDFLCKDPHLRRGYGKSGSADAMGCALFDDVDFKLVERKQFRVPFTPAKLLLSTAGDANHNPVRIAPETPPLSPVDKTLHSLAETYESAFESPKPVAPPQSTMR